MGDHAGRLHFIPQDQPRGYGHAVYCARDFVGDAPFLHLVGDHLYVSSDDQSCARQLVEVAQAEVVRVSAVQATRESLLPYYGAVGGKRVPGRKDLYVVETVHRKAHAHRGRTAPDRAGTARGALSVLLWDARPHADGDGDSGRSRWPRPATRGRRHALRRAGRAGDSREISGA